MGNTVAYAALLTWPLIAMILYRYKSIQIATLWTIIGGFMLLPVSTNFDFPMIPPMDKVSIPVISAFIGCWIIKGKHISFFKELGKIKYLVLLLFLVHVVSALLNQDALVFGPLILPGLTYYDGFSSLMREFFVVGSFFIGRQFFRSYDDQLLLFKFLVVAGLIYSLPKLFEIRMSPQLHTWVYGFFPHSFVQQMRFDGFRPVVFMGHGLIVAFFLVVVLVASVVLSKNTPKGRQVSMGMRNYYILTVLVLSKGVAAAVYGLVAFLLIKFVRPKTQYVVAISLVMLSVTYPAMSIMKIFPHQSLLNLAADFSAERAESLKFRFDNEKILLERAEHRIFFGWGGWGRNRVYNDSTGDDESITDGHWIITIGDNGLFGFLAEFGLLGMVVFRAFSASKLVKERSEQRLLAAHALLIGILMVDQIPNSSLGAWLWLLAGILLGRSEDIISEHKAGRKQLVG